MLGQVKRVLKEFNDSQPSLRSSPLLPLPHLNEFTPLEAKYRALFPRLDSPACFNPSFIHAPRVQSRLRYEVPRIQAVRSLPVYEALKGTRYDEGHVGVHLTLLKEDGARGEGMEGCYGTELGEVNAVEIGEEGLVD